MKLFKKFTVPALLGLLAAGAFSSCNTDDPDDNYTRHIMTGSFGCITSIGTQTQTMSPQMTYELEYNYSTGAATVEITGLQMPDGTKYPTITLQGMTWKQKDGWRIIECPAPMVSMSGFTSGPIFENVTIGLMDRIYDGAYIPAFYVRARINNIYSLFSSLCQQYLFGTTETTMPDGRVTTTRSTGYTFTLNPNTMPLTATIGVAGASFAPSMPSQNYSFENVPCTLNSNSTISFSAESLIPVQNKVPNPEFPVSDLSGVYDIVNGMTMDYNCMVKGVELHAKATLDLVSAPEQ